MTTLTTTKHFYDADDFVPTYLSINKEGLRRWGGLGGSLIDPWNTTKKQAPNRLNHIARLAFARYLDLAVPSVAHWVQG